MMITKSFERKLEKLGAFEISFDMLKLSEKNGLRIDCTMQPMPIWSIC